MRTQEEATQCAEYHAVQLVDALQDADAPDSILDRAEELQSEVSGWSNSDTIEA